ncbi:hypothetical protein NEIMUCOT_04648 [Neisseria mucosa ATCC 25996]|jgi:hypothetical protein|uniref:Uncharacterized protein n=1 Tax=Neisseria mucosa (strain ATCC 25996 / DSM 4631 / NCTC 10774 / M26) TaxID=546266 RepID=D2ZVK5_NEIM2|nr:hypothetical protein NEIMUCOT_04648 [Neisseria mucosa ATCC 25996]SUA94035.1 Uncharacterised protein [Neisseria mucosa]
MSVYSTISLFIISPPTNPKAIGSNPMEKVSFALARLRPSSDHADGLHIESRLANLTDIASNPMEENQLRPRSVETELRLC